MKKGLIWMVLAVLSFAYELGVLKKDADILKEAGIKCTIKGKYCVFFKGDDKAQIKRIKYYLSSQYNIKAYEVSVNSNKTPAKTLKGIYSYQFGSETDLKKAIKVLKRVKSLPDARIEKIGKYYVIRAGLFHSYKKAKQYSKGYFIVKCYYIPSRVVKIL